MDKTGFKADFTEEDRADFLRQCDRLLVKQEGRCRDCQAPIDGHSMRANYCIACLTVHGVFCSPCWRKAFSQYELENFHERLEERFY